MTPCNFSKMKRIEPLTSSQQFIVFSDLPIEITENVIHYLDRRDIIECICVSLSWNTLFYPALFHSVKCQSSEQFSELFQIMKQSAKQGDNKRRRIATTPSKTSLMTIQRPPNIGYNIRDLDIRSGIMSNITMDALAKYCPNVRTLVFRWAMVGKNAQILISSSSHQPQHERHPTNHIARTPIPLLQRHHHLFSTSASFHYHSIRSLTLVKTNEYVFSGARRRIISTNNPSLTMWCSSVLCFVPQLKHLTFNIDQLTIDLIEMEALHTACPQLKTLEIFTAFIWSDKSNYSSNSMTSSSASTVFDPSSVEPARSIEKLILQCNGWMDNHPFDKNPLFIYIQHKYPGLKRLSMTSIEKERNHRLRFPQLPLSQEPSPPLPPYSHADTIQLKSLFPQLEHLDIGPFSKRSSTGWPRLVYGIPSITLLDNPSNCFETWVKDIHTPSPAHYDQQLRQPPVLLQQLVIRILPKALDNFQYCIQLCHLTLDGKRHNWGKLQILPLDILLRHCHSLEYLYIKAFHILCQEDEATAAAAITSRFKKMIVENATLRNSGVLTRISQLCPQLGHLNITNCKWRIPEDECLIVHINMPNQRFSRLELNGLGTCRKLRGYIGRRPEQELPVASADPAREEHPIWTMPDPSFFGATDYLLLKTNRRREQPPKGEGEYQQSQSLILFKYEHQYMERVKEDSTETISWLEKKISNERPTPGYQKRYSQKTYGSWPVIIHCQHVDRLYFDGKLLNQSVDEIL
ncbi:hypothetical protein BDA99DRAFT_528529 [Phascolomyces articulosus]|uniref:F-box domain-containing protein n=1 Tax=Phascolomyces articulosus TaxID=60185 RepID=A0AAD5P7B2_9FUNG|nr:hypothetical protein BDA99DRAFT_528529 [Phascolomyces articulosus]